MRESRRGCPSTRNQRGSNGEVVGAGPLAAASGLAAELEAICDGDVRVTLGVVPASLSAGVLLGLHGCWDLARCLLTGVCAAAASLSDPTCTAGVKSLNAALALAKKYGFRPKLGAAE